MKVFWAKSSRREDGFAFCVVDNAKLWPAPNRSKLDNSLERLVTLFC